mgnify:CR=1 FL=1
MRINYKVRLLMNAGILSGGLYYNKYVNPIIYKDKDDVDDSISFIQINTFVSVTIITT